METGGGTAKKASDVIVRFERSMMKKTELEKDHEACLSLCERQLAKGTFGGLMAATVYLVEAQKISGTLSKI